MINSDNKSNGPIDTIEAEYHKGAVERFTKQQNYFNLNRDKGIKCSLLLNEPGH